VRKASRLGGRGSWASRTHLIPPENPRSVEVDFLKSRLEASNKRQSKPEDSLETLEEENGKYTVQEGRGEEGEEKALEDWGQLGGG